MKSFPAAFSRSTAVCEEAKMQRQGGKVLTSRLRSYMSLHSILGSCLTRSSYGILQCRLWETVIAFLWGSYHSIRGGGAARLPTWPLLFCHTIQPFITKLRSVFSIFFLDDCSVGGNVDDVLHDLCLITEEVYS